MTYIKQCTTCRHNFQNEYSSHSCPPIRLQRSAFISSFIAGEVRLSHVERPLLVHPQSAYLRPLGGDAPQLPVHKILSTLIKFPYNGEHASGDLFYLTLSISSRRPSLNRQAHLVHALDATTKLFRLVGMMSDICVLWLQVWHDCSKLFLPATVNVEAHSTSRIHTHRHVTGNRRPVRSCEV